MILSEAIEAATAIIERYPNGGANAGDSYIGALAAMLASYPRQVAMRCADPVRGIVRTCKFLPTVADVVAFCEREVTPLYDEAKRERLIAAQLAERERSETDRPSPEQIARVEAMRREVVEHLTRPNAAAIAVREKKAAASRQQRIAEIYAEWKGEEAPTIAGIPISRELHGMLTNNGDSNA